MIRNAESSNDLRAEVRSLADAMLEDVYRLSVGDASTSNAAVLYLSPQDQVNCEECLRAYPAGEAQPRLESGGRNT